MSYTPDKWTDKELEALEKRIAQVYKEAEKELSKEVNEYFAKFKIRDKEMKALVDAGEMTNADYMKWRTTQMGRGQRFEALRDKVAERYTKANEVANAYVNDKTPSIYSLNRNYEAYQIEKAVGSCDFTMWDESTVRRLIVEEPDLMPYYPPSRALQRGIDLAYGKDQITKRVTSGIIRGLAPSKIATELMQGITTMNRESAVRAARTGITAAQNAGRLDSWVAAEKMGIKIRRRWICTKDARTRTGHAMADGQIVEGTKTPFVVDGEKMMFPGDKSLGAHGWNIYNCRCSTRTVEKDGIEAEPRQMRVRDPETGEWKVVNEMTYSEWYEWKTGEKFVAKTKNSGVKAAGNLTNTVKSDSIKMMADINKMITPHERKVLDSVPPKEGFFDFAAHGASGFIEYGSHEKRLSAREVARIIQHNENYKGEKVRLLSCYTGSKDGGFAQQLANALGVEVEAPTDILLVYPNGRYMVGLDGSGTMKVFKPGVKG